MVSDWKMETKMGTYTTNKELFMPTVGEQGWGTLVNGNFETIDNFLKPITVSGSTYTFTGNQTGGTITATKITNSGTLTQTGTSTFTGKIAANGGIEAPNVNGVVLKNSGTITVTPTNDISCYLSTPASSTGNGATPYAITLLPYNGCKYTGSIKFKSPNASKTMYISSGVSDTEGIFQLTTAGDNTYTFTDASYLSVMITTGANGVQLYGFTLS